MPYFVWLACAAFALPLKVSLPQPMSFLTFTLPVLSPMLLQRSEWVLGWGQAAYGAAKLATVHRKQWCPTPFSCLTFLSCLPKLFSHPDQSFESTLFQEHSSNGMRPLFHQSCTFALPEPLEVRLLSIFVDRSVVGRQEICSLCSLT